MEQGRDPSFVVRGLRVNPEPLVNRAISSPRATSAAPISASAISLI